MYLHQTANHHRTTAPIRPSPESHLSDKSLTETFHRDVVRELSQRPKTLPAKYFYDPRGAQLFERICELDEYYLTRTELSIMRKYAAQMGSLIPEHGMLVEFGSGSSLKTRLLLKHVPKPLTYVPVDISEEHLYQSASSIADEHPGVEVLPVCADFTKDFTLPRHPLCDQQVVVFFPGSTIGNFLPVDVTELLGRITKLCGSGGGLLIGIDLQKDPQIIEAAYNDKLGVTAEFNLNLLRRINRELHADFDTEAFYHRAEYNQELHRIEMHLVSRTSQSVRIGEKRFRFAKGESICTEYSHKYRIDQFSDLAARTGLTLEHSWTDPQSWFAVLHFRVTA